MAREIDSPPHIDFSVSQVSETLHVENQTCISVAPGVCSDAGPHQKKDRDTCNEREGSQQHQISPVGYRTEHKCKGHDDDDDDVCIINSEEGKLTLYQQDRLRAGVFI